MTGLEAVDKLRDKIVYGVGDYHEMLECLDYLKQETKALEIIKKHIKIVNGQLMFKGISYKKNIKDYELLKEELL